MTTADKRSNAASAANKVSTGALMRITEVAAMLDIAPATVHALALPSIRIGRSLRFDPRDVSQLIANGREPVILLDG